MEGILEVFEFSCFWSLFEICAIKFRIAAELSRGRTLEIDLDEAADMLRALKAVRGVDWFSYFSHKAYHKPVFRIKTAMWRFQKSSKRRMR